MTEPDPGLSLRVTEPDIRQRRLDAHPPHDTDPHPSEPMQAIPRHSAPPAGQLPGAVTHHPIGARRPIYDSSPPPQPIVSRGKGRHWLFSGVWRTAPGCVTGLPGTSRGAFK